VATKKFIHDLPFEDAIFDAVFTDPEQINEEFARVSADLAYWNTVYALRSGDAARLDVECRRTKAAKYLYFREEIAQQGGRPTDEWVKSLVDSDEEVNLALLLRVDADAEKQRIYGIVDAIRAKKDMLVSIGATLRSELEHDPMIKEQRRFDRARSRKPPEE
jgi:hypothetical protein